VKNNFKTYPPQKIRIGFLFSPFPHTFQHPQGFGNVKNGVGFKLMKKFVPLHRNKKPKK